MYIEKILELYYAKPGIRQILGLITLFSLAIIEFEVIFKATAGNLRIINEQINSLRGYAKPDDLAAIIGAAYYILSSLMKILMIFGHDFDRDFYYYVFTIYFLYLLAAFAVCLYIANSSQYQISTYQYSALTGYLAYIFVFGYPLADIIDFIMDKNKRSSQLKNSCAQA